MIVLKDVLALLDGELLTPATSPEAAFRKVFASDLMSDVLTSAEPGSLLLTGLANAHVVCTCSVADLSGVVFVQGKRPAPTVVDEARTRGIPLMATKMTMFEACSRIAGFDRGRGHGRR
ncbi:MAG: DRTGG domain-containing protein [Candidatus Moduliflexus flocculans]|nr:DRTGG domain-containing protein [Candidatus Moduliflexus flocculans]